MSLVGLFLVWYGANACRTPHFYRNVILITFDSARFDVFPRWCGNEIGRPVPMPALERLCMKSIVFTRAYTPFPATAPALASIYTGFTPFHHFIDMDHPIFLSPAFPTLAEVLHEHHVRTILIAGNNWFIQPHTGFARGFDRVITPRALTAGRDPEKMVRYAIGEWQKCKKARRCFIHLHLFEPHEPYGAPGRFFTPPLNRASSFTSPRWLKVPIQQARDSLFRHYRAGLRWADHALGEWLQRLETDPDHARTLVIVTSDHGEGFGEHHYWGHNNAVFEEAVHIPFIIHTPHHRHRVESHLLSLEDLYVSVPNAMGIRLMRQPFSSLRIPSFGSPSQVNRRGSQTRQFIIIEGHDRDRSVAVIHRDDKLIFYRKNRLARLYRLRDDPNERRNIIAYAYRSASNLFALIEPFFFKTLSPARDTPLRSSVRDKRVTEELLKTLGYTGAQFVRVHRRFILFPSPLPVKKTKAHIRVHRIPVEKDGAAFQVNLQNIGDVAWPATRLPGKPYLAVICSVRERPKFRRVMTLPKDTYPGQQVRLSFMIPSNTNIGGLQPECQLVPADPTTEASAR